VDTRGIGATNDGRDRSTRNTGIRTGCWRDPADQSVTREDSVGLGYAIGVQCIPEATCGLDGIPDSIQSAHVEHTSAKGGYAKLAKSKPGYQCLEEPCPAEPRGGRIAKVRKCGKTNSRLEGAPSAVV
jgi:hypothetical protein